MGAIPQVLIGAIARLREVEPDISINWIVYPSRMPLRALLEREMSDAGIAMPTNFIETASTFATVALLQRSSDLVALLPQAVCEFFSAQKLLRTMPIALRSRTQPFGVVTRSGGRRSAVAQRLIDVLIEGKISRTCRRRAGPR